MFATKIWFHFFLEGLVGGKIGSFIRNIGYFFKLKNLAALKKKEEEERGGWEALFTQCAGGGKRGRKPPPLTSCPLLLLLASATVGWDEEEEEDGGREGGSRIICIFNHLCAICCCRLATQEWLHNLRVHPFLFPPSSSPYSFRGISGLVMLTSVSKILTSFFSYSYFVFVLFIPKFSTTNLI